MADISADSNFANNNLTAQMEPGLRPSLPPPTTERGAIGWLRHNLFSSWTNTILTVIAVYLIGVTVPHFISWAIVNATWSIPPTLEADHQPQFSDCRVNTGACWIFVEARLPQFIYGFYPADERWRVN